MPTFPSNCYLRVSLHGYKNVRVCILVRTCCALILLRLLSSTMWSKKRGKDLKCHEPSSVASEYVIFQTTFTLNKIFT